MKIGTLSCWLFGHSFVYWRDWDTRAISDTCVRCGEWREKCVCWETSSRNCVIHQRK